ncbi:MAG: GNAT family N-acetyltransferase [Actinomycetota bacterium]
MSGGAWELAHEAASAAGVQLRPLTSLADADAIVGVMRETWGEELPRELIRALAGSGNVPWGAFDGDELIGYVLGWAAVEPSDGLHEHSHMLAALPHRRHAGVGYALKLAQRASCLDRGIGLVRWTFDPLVARNAHLNIGKLGATCDRFHRDYYGEMTDAVNAGDRSDRLVVRWRLDRDPGPRDVPAGEVVEVVRGSGAIEAPRPELSIPVPDVAAGSVIAIQVPRDHATIRANDPELGGRWREVVAEALVACFARGMEVVAFEADLAAGRPRYFLTAKGGARS